ncbi:MAG: methyltransferase domain-containing protein [Gaiellaceae bacterium]
MLARVETGSKAHEQLVDLLRCPACAGSMTIAREDTVVCEAGLHRFPIVEGVLVLVGDEDLADEPQYEHQRSYFDSEFANYRDYRPDLWRVSYLRRLRGSSVLGATAEPVIDVGVGGSGHTVIEAARAGAPAVGCDLSLAGLIVARRFAAAEGLGDRTLWVCCSAEKLPFAEGVFAAALAIAVIEHVPNDDRSLSEIARVLQPGGRAWVTVPHALHNIARIFRPANRRHDVRLGHLRRYDAEALIAKGRGFGLEPVQVEFTGHPIKVVQLLAGKVLRRGVVGRRFWWWCETRDLRRAKTRRGSMQLSVVFARSNR